MNEDTIILLYFFKGVLCLLLNTEGSLRDINAKDPYVSCCMYIKTKILWYNTIIMC